MAGSTKSTRAVQEPQLVAKDLRVDAKSRISLAKALARFSDAPDAFDVYVEAGFRIVLEPRVSVPAREAWLFKSPKALSMVRQGLAEMAAGQSEDLGSFARYARKK